MIILNFHGVGPVTRDVDAGERDCWLDPLAFEQVLDLVRGKSHVRLTVDDGNASDHDLILPALLARGLKADFFVCSGRIGEKTFLSREQILTLRDRGMGIGSHGVVHRPWRHLRGAELEQEIAGSRATLERALGVKVDTAACPFGSYGRVSLACLRRAGYRTVYTSDGGAAHEGDWLLPRTTITRDMSMESIRDLIDHGPSAGRQASIRLRGIIKRLRN
jgi:peptidoglycan/xylan/chitin deacetylase (PgdA/CDA1 family)